MKFTRRVQYNCTTVINGSEVNESLDIEDTFDLDLSESITDMDSIAQITKDLIHEIKKEVPCVESESSSME